MTTTHIAPRCNQCTHLANLLDRPTLAELHALTSDNFTSAYATPYTHIPSRYGMTRAILTAWRNTTDANRSLGAQWYPAMHTLLERIAVENGRSTERVVAAFAQLSPGCDLTNNLRSLLGVIDGTSSGLPGYPAAVARAHRALSHGAAAGGCHLDAHATLDRSRKVKSFYANLMGATGRVTVDRWAQRVAGVDDAISQAKGGGYLAIERAYQRAAEIEGVEPRVMQAATWTAARGGAGIDGLHQLIGV